jgi:hypothetical protein
MEVIIFPNFDPLPGKNDPHIRVLVAFRGPDGIKYGAKTASI